MPPVYTATNTCPVSHATGIVPALHALCGHTVPRGVVAAFVVAECGRTDFDTLESLVRRHRTLTRAEKAMSDGVYSHIAYSDMALSGLREAHRAAIRKYAQLNPMCITVEYDGDYSRNNIVEFLTYTLVKSIACGELSLNDRY